MKRIMLNIIDRLCGQPDLLKNSRSLALKQIMSIPEEKPERPRITIGAEVTNGQ